MKSVLPLIITLLLFSNSFSISLSQGISTRNILGIERPYAYGLPKIKKGYANKQDTIHIIAFRVRFSKDATTLTTGDGTFNSDDSYYSGDVYKFDKKPHDRQYFADHLEFLKNYYKEVSDNRLIIEYEVYPQNPKAAYEVPKEMRDYHPWKQNKNETYCEFGERKADSIMNFVKDAIKAADTSPDKGNPFEHNYDENKTVYLLIHAGASPFADGGYYQALGDASHNTPADFFDFFVSQRDIKYFLGQDEFKVANGNTHIKDIMMVSETANQDSVNFGINGILVNQFANQLGVPNLFGVSNCFGISAIGSFCIMDFAGYNAGFGFNPPYPSAWVRAFLGWTKPTICKPGVDSTYKVFAANLDTTNEILQIPLNENEYILVENRQRNLDNRNWFKKDTIDGKTYTGSLILDSVVVAEGNSNVVINSKDFEAGLPGSGLLFWHIDESILRSYYKYNAVNADSSRRAVSLIEGDGIQDIGAQFSNALGTTVQDYGQAYDFLPHFDVAKKALVDSLQDIYTNDGGYVNLKISNIKPHNPKIDTIFAEGHGKENGKGVINYTSEYFSLDVKWNSKQRVWPQLSDSGTAQNHVASLDLCDSTSGKEIVAVSDNGKIYAWTINGTSLGNNVDTIAILNQKAIPDTLRNIYRYSIVNLNDKLCTPAVYNDTLYTAGKRNVYMLFKTDNDTIKIDSTSISNQITDIFISNSGQIYAVNTINEILNISNNKTINTVFKTESPITALAIDDINNNSKDNLIVALQNGEILNIENNVKIWNISTKTNSPQISIGNIDNSSDNSKEIAVIGKNGAIFLLNNQGDYNPAYWPVNIDRNNTSIPALADLNADGILDIIISGTNKIYALDLHGNFLANWPVIIADKTVKMEINCSPTVANIDNDSNPEVLIGYGLEDTIYYYIDPQSGLDAIDTTKQSSYNYGNIMAIKYTGSMPGHTDSKNNFITTWPFSTSTPVISSVFADDIDNDNKLEIFGISKGGWLYSLPLNSSGKVIWNGGKANTQRNCSYSDSLLPAKISQKSNESKINTLYCFPNPVISKNTVTIRYELSNNADKVSLTMYDPANELIGTIENLTKNNSWNRYVLDISKYSSGVYRAKLVVKKDNQRKVKFCKIAIIK